MPKRRSTKHIRFIVTGDLERLALQRSIAAWFPDETVEGHPVEWSTGPMFGGATTYRLQAGKAPNSSMTTLAKALVSEIYTGESGTPADLVVVVDDLELGNLDQPATVCAHFAAAVDADITRRSLPADDEAELRSRVARGGSFHLLSPMVEAYFFGEGAALRRAGCPDDVEPQLRAPDVEAFESTDPDYIAARCAGENARQQQTKPWWREERHPKHYLEHLMDVEYRETRGGTAALVALDWPGVPADEQSTPLISALFADIADFFGVPSPLGPTVPSPDTYIGAKLSRADQGRLLLRNMWRDPR